MKRMMLIASLVAAPAFANGGSSGLVTNMIAVAPQGRVFFDAGVVNGKPACSQSNSWALDVTTAAGKAIYAMLLTAQTAGKPVFVSGNGTCDIWGDRETVTGVSIGS